MTTLHRGVQTIRVTRQPGTRHGGLLTVSGMTLRCQLGRSGVTALKREGDGATPMGRMRLLTLLHRADRSVRPAGAFGRNSRAIDPSDGWSDDMGDGRYNRFVRLPFAGSHERLWREDALYDVIGILDWNMSVRVLGRGSAIFLHLARDDGGPTAGCIALAPRDMRRLLTLLRPGAVFCVV